MMNDMALMISWMSSWWHPNSWWHFDYHRISPLNRGVMSWNLTNCNDSITAWYHKIPVCFGQTWQSPWWYQEKNGDIHEIDHDIQNLTMTPQSRFNCLRWRDGDILEYDWQKSTRPFTRIHHDIEIYVMVLSDCVLIILVQISKHGILWMTFDTYVVTWRVSDPKLEKL